MNALYIIFVFVAPVRADCSIIATISVLLRYFIALYNCDCIIKMIWFFAMEHGSIFYKANLIIINYKNRLMFENIGQPFICVHVFFAQVRSCPKDCPL